MEALFGIILVVTGVVSLVCWIMVLVKIFKENVGLGILGLICGLFTFIYGWVKVQEYNNRKIMLIWTIATVVSMIAYMLGGAMLFQRTAGEMQMHMQGM